MPEEKEIGYGNVKTPKELLDLINNELDWCGGPLGFTSENEACQAAIVIRAENLSFNLPPVPSGGNVLDIQNWCIDAQKIMDEANSPKVEPACTKPVEAEQENKEKQEEMLEPKPPEFLQKLLWVLRYGRNHWKLILLAAMILLFYIIIRLVF